MIKWGFIGCGAVTEKKSGPAFRKVKGSDVVAVMRRDENKAKDYAQRHSIDTWYSDAYELINDARVNAIYVATPPSSHAEYAIAAMKAGKPVYIEKPMAASYEDCLRIQQVSEATGIPCFVAYYRRSLPYFNRVKQLIQEGELGELSTVHIQLTVPPYAADYDKGNLPWRVKKEIAGAGYFYDLASHQFDLFEWLFGEVTEAHGLTQNRAGLYNAEDSVVAQYKFRSGMLGSGNWSFVAPAGTRTDLIEVVGTKGKLTFSTFNFSPILLETSAGNQEYIEKNPDNIQFFLIQSIVNYLNGGDELPVSTAQTAPQANWVMDQILGKSKNDL